MIIKNNAFETEYGEAYLNFPTLFSKQSKGKIQHRPYLEKTAVETIPLLETALRWQDDVTKRIAKAQKQESHLQSLISNAKKLEPGKWPDPPYPTWKGIPHNSTNPPVEGWDIAKVFYYATGPTAESLKQLKICRIVGFWHGELSYDRTVTTQFEIAQENRRVINRYLTAIDALNDAQKSMGSLYNERNTASHDVRRFTERIKQYE